MASLNLVIIGSILVVGVHGGSVAGLTGGKNCSVADNYLGLSCGLRAIEFGEKIQNLDLDNDVENELKEFKRSCAALEDCTKTLGHCNAFQDEEVKKGFAHMKTFCDVIIFFSGEFAECENELDAKNSTCYQDWDPFGLLMELEDKAKITKACNVFFGKENCMKKETIAVCGEKSWEKLRDTMIVADDAGKKCNIKSDL